MRKSMIALLLLACVALRMHAEEGKRLEVFAAASLTESFTALGKRFEAAHPKVAVVFSFGASNQLRAQIELGGRADVFASANMKEMDSAVASKHVAADAVKVFARNRLVVIYPKANPAQINALADLAKPKLKVVLAHKAVPVGKYALEMLEKMSKDAAYGAEFKPRVLQNVVSEEESVKAVVAKIRVGAGEAGVVYVSDLTAATLKEVGTLDVPAAFNVVADYPIAPLAKAPQAELATGFVALVLSPDGQAMLKKAGFVPVDDKP